MNGVGRYFQHADTLFRLQRHARGGPEAIRRFQERKLRFLVNHARENVPLYQNKFDAAGVRVKDIRGLDDLPLIPRTTKPEMRAAGFREQTASGTSRKEVLLRYTAGSTGEPAHIYRKPVEDHLLNQFRIRASRLLGERPNDSVAVLRMLSGPTDHMNGLMIRAVKALLPGKRALLECLRPPEAIASDLVELQPDIIRSLPGILAEVAVLWPRSNPDVRNPRQLLASGEPLTPNLRRSIEEGFGAPVHNAYMSHEFNLLAWECPETGLMHVCDDNVIVEVLRDGSPAATGESGDVVVTGLHSYTAPLIRYELGDIAVRGPDRCPCGAPFSTLDSIRGRTMDMCVLPDGRRLHHWDLIPLGFWDMSWFRRYQLVQKSPVHFVLRLVLDREPPAEDIEQLEKAICERLGPQGRFEFEFTDEIAVAQTGKHYVCRSEVDMTAEMKP
jgi:phenylacetate-CoA ligase